MNFDFEAKEVKARQAIDNAFGKEEGEILCRLDGADLTNLQGLTRRAYGRLGETGYFDESPSCLSRAAMDLRLAYHSPSLCLSAAHSRSLANWSGQSSMPDNLADTLCSLAKGDVIAATTCDDGNLKLDGDSLTGRLAMVANAAFCDLLVIALPNEAENRLVFLKPDAKGLTINARLRLGGMGGLALCPVEFDGVKLSPQNSCTAPKKLIDDISTEFGLVLCAAATGLMMRTVDEVKHAANEAGAGAKPAMASQHVRFSIAELLTLAQTAELMLYRAAWLVDDGDDEAGTVVRAAKVFIAESVKQVTGEALQIAGIEGYAKGSFFERASRDARLYGIIGGETSAARLSVADDLLARYEE